MTIKRSFSYNSFVKLFLCSWFTYNMNSKHSDIMELHCMFLFYILHNDYDIHNEVGLEFEVAN